MFGGGGCVAGAQHQPGTEPRNGTLLGCSSTQRPSGGRFVTGIHTRQQSRSNHHHHSSHINRTRLHHSVPAQIPEQSKAFAHPHHGRCVGDDAPLSKLQKALGTPQVSFGLCLSAAGHIHSSTSRSLLLSAMPGLLSSSCRSLPVLLLVCALACTASAKAAGRQRDACVSSTGRDTHTRPGPYPQCTAAIPFPFPFPLTPQRLSHPAVPCCWQKTWCTPVLAQPTPPTTTIDTPPWPARQTPAGLCPLLQQPTHAPCCKTQSPRPAQQETPTHPALPPLLTMRRQPPAAMPPPPPRALRPSTLLLAAVVAVVIVLAPMHHHLLPAPSLATRGLVGCCPLSWRPCW